MKNKNLDLTEGDVAKVFLMFFLPMVAGGLLQQLYSTADAVIVGRFAGKEGLAAIDSVYQLFKFPLNFLSGMSAGATIIISSAYGKKSVQETDNAIHTAVLLGFLVGIIMSVIGAVFAPSLIRLMNVPDDIYSLTLTYVRIFFAGLWTTSLYNLLAGTLRATGDSKTPLSILTICCCINIVLDCLFVGVFRLGVAGAAVATVMSQGISCILAVRALTKNPMCSFSISKLKIQSEKMKKIITTGMPLGAQSMFYPVANSIIQRSVNGLGTDAIAARGVISKMDLLIWLIVDTLNPALATFVSRNIGAKKYDRIEKGVRAGVGFAVVSLIFLSTILYFFGGTIAKLFITSADYDIIPVIVTLLHIQGPFFVFYTFSEGLAGPICGTGDTFRPMVITLIGTCLLRVVWILTVVKRNYTIETVTWGYVVSWVVTGAIFIVYYFITKKRNWNVKDNNA